MWSATTEWSGGDISPATPWKYLLLAAKVNHEICQFKKVRNKWAGYSMLPKPYIFAFINISSNIDLFLILLRRRDDISVFSVFFFQVPWCMSSSTIGYWIGIFLLPETPGRSCRRLNPGTARSEASEIVVQVKRVQVPVQKARMENLVFLGVLLEG